jgi:hypothetical protein
VEQKKRRSERKKKYGNSRGFMVFFWFCSPLEYLEIKGRILARFARFGHLSSVHTDEDFGRKVVRLINVAANARDSLGNALHQKKKRVSHSPKERK